jgi:hypothetical protein
MWPRTAYVAPSGVQGTGVVFVFLTWNATGSDVTFTDLPAAPPGAARATAAMAALTTQMKVRRKTARC